MGFSHSKVLYPAGIVVHRVKSSPFYTAVQYEHDGFKWFAVNNLEKVLHKEKIDYFFPFCFYRDYLVTCHSENLFLSDICRIITKHWCSLRPFSLEPVRRADLSYVDHVRIDAPITDITIDADKILVAFKHTLVWYPIHTRYFDGVEPEGSVRVPGVTSITALNSFSAEFSRFHHILPAYDATRTVGVFENEFEPMVVKDETLVPASALDEPYRSDPDRWWHKDPGKKWRRVLIIADGHTKAITYDHSTSSFSTSQQTPSDWRFSTQYYPHTQYNPWHNFPAFYGFFDETYDEATGTWTQQYFDLEGAWDRRACIFDLVVDTVETDGTFTRSNNFLRNDLVSFTVVPSNLTLLTGYYLVFKVTARGAMGLPLFNTRACVKLLKDDPEVDQAIKYFDPALDGIDEDCALADWDGSTYVFLKTTDKADFPSYLQGKWRYEITVSANSVMSIEDAISFHEDFEDSTAPVSALERMRLEFKQRDHDDFFYRRKLFTYP